MLMFSLNGSILLMCVCVGKKSNEWFLFGQSSCGAGNILLSNLIAQIRFWKQEYALHASETEEYNLNNRFIFKKVNPNKSAIVINKGNIIFGIIYRWESRSPNISVDELQWSRRHMGGGSKRKLMCLCLLVGITNRRWIICGYRNFIVFQNLMNNLRRWMT